MAKTGETGENHDVGPFLGIPLKIWTYFQFVDLLVCFGFPLPVGSNPLRPTHIFMFGSTTFFPVRVSYI